MPGTVISPLHTSILKTGALLGYFSDNPIGCCNGFTLKWLSACLVGEETKFNQRVKTILNDEHLIENINRIKEKLKRGGEPSQDDKDYLEILEFYEGMLLFQSPNEHPELLGSGVSQFDVELMSPFASSDKMNELGGLVTVNSDVGLYTKEDIENHLNELAKRIDDTNYDSVDPIGFHLVNHNHAVGLTYNKTTHQWTFKDTNNASSLLNQDKLTTKEISREIFKGFKPAPSEDLIESMLDELPKNLVTGKSIIGSNITFNGKTAELSYQKEPEEWALNGKPITKQDAVQGVYRIFHGEKSLSPYVAFSTSTITTASNEKKFNLQAQLTSFKTPLHITAELVHMDACNELVEVAITKKREDIIIELIDHGMDVNQRLNDKNSTLAHQASQFGLIGVLEALAKHNANFNAATSGGYTSLISAVEYQQNDVIHWLLKHSVDLDAQMTSGATAMYFAAQKGDVEIIHALANRGAKLDIPLLKLGSTPILVAAINGHMLAVDALIEHGVNINAQADNGETAVYWAAKNGFAQAVFPLAEKSADLNIPSSTGQTPTWIAAYKGHLNVIQELFKYQANLDTPTNDGATPLFVAAQNGHTEIVKFLLTNSQSHSIAFISTTESLKKFAQSRGENVIQRMHEMLELKLSSRADKDHISLLPQEIAWIMDHQEVMQAFPVTSEDEIRRAPLRASIIAAILKVPKQDRWEAKLPDNVNSVDFTFMQLEIKKQGFNVAYHEPRGPYPAYFSITRPETSSRLSVGSTDPRWKAVNTSLSQLFASEAETIRNELLKQLRANPADKSWRIKLRNSQNSPFNQDATNAIKQELIAEGFVVEPRANESLDHFDSTLDRFVSTPYLAVNRPATVDPTETGTYISILTPSQIDSVDYNEREKISIREEIKSTIKASLYDKRWVFNYIDLTMDRPRFNTDAIESIKSELKHENFTVNYIGDKWITEGNSRTKIPAHMEIIAPTIPCSERSISIYTNILPPPITEIMKQTMHEFKSVSEQYLFKLEKDLTKYAITNSVDSSVTDYNEPNKKDEVDHWTWEKHQIVKSAWKQLVDPAQSYSDRMKAFNDIMIDDKNVDTLSKRRDSPLVGIAKIAFTLGAILVYRWAMNYQVTEGARNAKSFSEKYKELLQSEKSDSLKKDEGVDPDDPNQTNSMG